MRHALPYKAPYLFSCKWLWWCSSEGEGRGRAFAGWEALPHSAPLINLLAARAHAVHIYIFSSRLSKRGTEILAQISSPVDPRKEIFQGSPPAYVKPSLDVAHADMTWWVQEMEGSVNSWATSMWYLSASRCGVGRISLDSFSYSKHDRMRVRISCLLCAVMLC